MNNSTSHSKSASLGKDGRGGWQKSNKKWHRGKGCSQKKRCKPLKQVRVTCFFNDPYDTDLFWFIFMSVFVDDVINFLWNKQTICIKININYMYKTRYFRVYLIMVCKDNKEWTSELRVYYKRLEYNTISVIKNLTSRSSFISFGVLLFRPTLKAKFFVSQIKLQITFFHLAKTLFLIQHQVFIIWTGKFCHKIW